jgi:hypothetical protein
MDTGSGNGHPQYVTHTHMYNWLWTMAFLSGTVPTIILLVMCLVCLFYFTFMINHLGSRTTDLKEEPSRTPITGVTISQQTSFLRISAWSIFILNVVVVGTINGLYLWSTLLDLSSRSRILIQFTVGLFSFVWSVALLGGLPPQVKESKDGVWLFTCLMVINNVVIPCAVTALTSPSCYQVSELLSLISFTFM